jgi:hypothetical protein
MNNITFKDKFLQAQKGYEEALKEIFLEFNLLLYKNSYINGRFNEDCFQDLSERFIKCVDSFEFKDDIDKHDFLEILAKYHKKT